MRIRLLAGLLIAASIVPVHAREPQAAEESARVLPQKPARARLEAFHRRDHVRVKFHDGLVIRERGGELVDLGTGALSEAHAVLARFAGGTWRRAHTIDEARLDVLRARARAGLGRAVADLNLQFDFILPPGVSAEEVIDAFNALAIVELADAPQVFAPAPTPPDFQPNQVYLRHSPRGLSAENAWPLAGGNGVGVRVCDVEYSFNAAHADLPAVTVLGAAIVDPFNSPQHGTAVLGAMGAVPNGFGVTGIAHGASFHFAGANTVNGYHVDAGILAAVAVFSPGDVIVLEQQAFGPGNVLVPCEWDVTIYNAIQTAVGNGLIVVEAAANGGQNLDSATFSTGNGGHWPFLPQNDSGAILVGAGASPLGTNVDRSRLSSSCFGSTVDVQGWGEQVCTAGFGAIWSSEGVNQYYTGTFNGTSSATALVAGTAVALQAAHKASTGLVLTPAQMRAVLRATGAPQTDGANPATQQIGPRPDLTAAIQALGDAAGPTFCAGDLRGTGCPCANDAPATSGRGCVNSLGLAASLVARGSPVLSNDTLELLASGIARGGVALFAQGTLPTAAGAGVAFGDGVLCISGAYIRLGIAMGDANGTALWPAPSQPPISVGGLIAGPGTLHYQVVYRDAGAFCTAATSSQTNGVSANWAP